MQRPCRVGGNEFHLHALSDACLAFTEFMAGLMDGANDFKLCLRIDEEVDEAGAGDFEFEDGGIGRAGPR
jgi:hypothetical protein